MNYKGVCRTAPATPGLLKKGDTAQTMVHSENLKLSRQLQTAKTVEDYQDN